MLFTVKTKLNAEAQARQLSVAELFIVSSKQLAIFKCLHSTNDPRQVQVAELLDKKFTAGHQLLRAIRFSPVKYKSHVHTTVKKIDRDLRFQEKRMKRKQALTLLRQNTAKWVI